MKQHGRREFDLYRERFASLGVTGFKSFNVYEKVRSIPTYLVSPAASPSMSMNSLLFFDFCNTLRTTHTTREKVPLFNLE